MNPHPLSFTAPLSLRLKTAVLPLLALLLVFTPASTALALGPFTHGIVESESGTQGHALGDIDGDGFVDVVLAEGEFSPRVFAWYKYPAWTKHPINDAEFPGLDYVPDCTLADIDQDGDLDLVLPNSRNSGNKELYWFENPRPGGDPTATAFTKHTVWSASSDHIKDVAVADFDRDGRLDIVIRQETTVRIFFQNSSPPWTSIDMSIPGHEGMAVGDLNNDGWVDVVCNGYWLKNPQDRAGTWTQLTVDAKWFNQSTGSWQDNSCRVQVADINRDGRAEPVFSHSEKAGYPVSYYTSADPDNGPWTEHQAGQVDYCHSLYAGDADGDGDIDLLAATLPSASSDRVVVLVNEDGFGLTWSTQVVDTVSSYIAKWADLDHDRDLDIVGSRSYDTKPIEVWLNQTDPPRGPAMSGLLLK